VFIHPRRTGHAPETLCCTKHLHLAYDRIPTADSPWSLTINQAILPHSLASHSSLGQHFLQIWRPDAQWSFQVHS